MLQEYKQDLILFYKTIKSLKVSRIKLSTIFILMILSNILQLATPLLFGNIINAIINKSMHLIKLNLLCMFLIFAISTILNYINSTMLIKLTYNLELNMKGNIFSSILEMPYSKFLKNDKGKLINNIEDDASVFSGLISDNLNILIQFINMIISFLFMIYISPLLTFIIILTFPITGILFMYSGKQIKTKEIEYRNNHDKFISFLYESLYGWKFLKIFNAENKRNNIFRKDLQTLNFLRIKKFKIELISQILTGWITFIINVLNIVVAVYLIFNGKLTLGMLTAFNEYSEGFKSTLLMFSKLNSTIQQISVSITRVNEVLKYNIEKIAEKIKKTKLSSSIEELTVRNLSYSTSENIEILKNTNLKFSKNNIYVIKGESGSGKTTLLNILSNFLENYTGEILLNNTELKHIDTKFIRNKISYITQENYLFSMSIKENIALYRDIDLDDIENVCKKLNIHETIMALPEKYDTIINKNGTNLSGGQIQRLCIARAIVTDPDVYLFDEITSSIDKKNTDEIVNIIEEISKNSIVILTSHEDLKFSIPTIEYHLENKNFEIRLEEALQI
ncbi:ABC transporter ATP-binding protein [Paraclostridium ghonii]|uniref:ABC-type bacteriocin/lantibiotic exporter with double-glycine peptidase domain n=1 Tax=Paraclostridium ghonii TaxID=29358 RepID=A0ABU0MYI8_9FIRM|nr:ABC transporter ATP-binding protein [Paeniclostridium ghonii]MDQ0555970.1 ABC-type bacteriocin/lantibiotic exporter with double-glycine peptidase domain [Paeniclostridium ghonii]